MTPNALVTFFGDVLLAEAGALRVTVLENALQPVLSLDDTAARQGSALRNAPVGIGLQRVSPLVYHLLDPQGEAISIGVDGNRDRSGAHQSWRELSCLALGRFPAIAPATADATPIPKTIHFICNDSRNLDPVFEANIRNTAAMNPGWAIRLWDEAARFQYLSDEYGWEVLKIYLMIGAAYGAAKADFFRYFLLYREGGVYLDLKSTTARPLDSILRPDDQYLLSQWNMSGSGQHAGWGLGASIAHVPGGEFQQWFIVSRAGHAFLRRTIMLMLTKILTYRPQAHGAGMVTTLNITGPHAYTRAIYPVLNLHPHRVVDAEQDGLVYTVVDRHRDRIGSDYRKACTPMITGNETALI